MAKKRKVDVTKGVVVATIAAILGLTIAVGHEISSFIPHLNAKKQIVAPMKVETKNGNRTFRIIYNSADDYSHAEDIARKYGLEFKE